ncbi:MAG: hypothetical protein DRI86_15290 [Bacteroidetes bacterium]|nr:MAG: hypothetical protein DRI86_15290 [Bacteroidota bacterium]
MNKTRFISIGFGLLLAVLVLSSSAIADSNKGIGYQENSGLVTITTGNATIIVQTRSGEPMFQYFTNDGFNYTIIFKQLIEYYDLNNDGAFQYNETIPGVPIFTLMSVKWTFSGFIADVDENNVVTAVHFNFTSSTVMNKFYDSLDMVIAAHIFLYDTTIDSYTIEGGTELKFDIIINSYPWMKTDSNLALRFDITPAKGAKVSDCHGKPIDTNTNTTNMEKRVEHKENQVKQRINIQAGNHEGYFAYANQSRIRTTTQNQYHNAPVNASISTDGKGDLSTFLSFSHFDQLIYDPSIGSTTIEETSTSSEGNTTTTVPIAFIAVLISTVSIGALIRKRINN